MCRRIEEGLEIRRYAILQCDERQQLHGQLGVVRLEKDDGRDDESCYYSGEKTGLLNLFEQATYNKPANNTHEY